MGIAWMPYSAGRKRWWALGLAGVWTWLPWLIGEFAQVTPRWSFGSALVYFVIVSAILWGVFTVGDWVRHARRT